MEQKINFAKQISKDSASLGFTIFSCFLLVGILFVGFNLIFLIFANMSRALQYGPEYKVIIIELLIAIIFVILALLATKRYALLKVVSVIYKYLAPFFKKLCTQLVGKIYQRGVKITKNDKISNLINIGMLWKESYDTKVPRLAQKGIVFLINKIPFAELFLRAKSELANNKEDENHVVISGLLYQQIDQYIQEKILKTNTFIFIFILFLVNVAVQLGVNYFFHR